MPGGPLVCHVVVLEIRDSGEGSLPPSEIRSSTCDSARLQKQSNARIAQKKSANSLFFVFLEIKKKKLAFATLLS